MVPYSTSGISFELFGNVSLLTFDIILRCAFSYENDVQTKGLVLLLDRWRTVLGLWFELAVSDFVN